MLFEIRLSKILAQEEHVEEEAQDETRHNLKNFGNSEARE